MKFYLIAFLFACSMQLTDVKVGAVKFGDAFSMAIMFFFILNIKNLRIPKFYARMLFCFLFFLLSSFVVLFWVKIYQPSEVHDLLRSAGWVSVSRFIQLVSCLCFALFIHKKFARHSSKHNIKFLYLVDNFTMLFFIFFMLAWFAGFMGIDNSFIYGSNRLRGAYIEGGPFGLFVGSYFLFRTCIFGFSKKWLAVAIALILMTQSKAAIVFLFFTCIAFLFAIGKIKIKTIAIASISFIMLAFLAINKFGALDRVYGYWQDYEAAEQLLSNRQNDNSFVMGRIAASYIVPNIIRDNLLLGVGLGNYSLVRNNPDYRGLFPNVPGWDLTGLGSFVNIAVESGIIGLIFFCLPFLLLWKRKIHNNKIKFIILIFAMAQVFGVQTYFQYIWFFIGTGTAINSIEVV